MKSQLTRRKSLRQLHLLMQAEIEILRDGKVSKVRVELKGPHKLIPSHIRCRLRAGRPPAGADSSSSSLSHHKWLHCHSFVKSPEARPACS